MAETDEFDLSDAEDYFGPEALDLTLNHALPALLQLPPEILTTITEAGLSQHQDPQEQLSDEALSYLKTIRFVHPLLARLVYVQSQLFKCVKLTANPDKLRALERNAVVAGPFVRQVVFKQAEIHRRDMPPDRRKDYNSTVEAILRPRIQRAVRSGRVLQTWINTLRQCHKAVDFLIITNPECNSSIVYYGPSPHDLLELALQALTVGACKPRCLRMRHCTQSVFVYTLLQEWEELDLSNLRSLEFDVVLDSKMNKEDYSRSFDIECSAIFALLLHSSKHTMQELELGGTGCILFPTSHLDTLRLEAPSLKSITFSNTRIDAEKTAAWISSAPSLRHVSFDRVLLATSNEIDNWRPIFEAVRQHSGNLTLRFTDIALLCPAAGPCASLTMQHQVAQAPEYERQNHKVLEEIADMLKLFLSGQDEWNVEEHWDIDTLDLSLDLSNSYIIFDAMEDFYTNQAAWFDYSEPNLYISAVDT